MPLAKLLSPPEQVSCSACVLRESCLLQGTSSAEAEQLDQLIAQRFMLQRGHYLYRKGTAFRSLFAIRSGFLKSSISDTNGREQITGFHMPGDVVGVGGMIFESYILDLVALEDSEICEIPFSDLEELSETVPRLQHNVQSLLARYVARDRRTIALLRTEASEARLAGFLLDFSTRWKARGHSGSSIPLPMSRRDLAHHLGLTEEVVCDSIAALEAEGAVAIKAKTLELRDMDKLAAFTGTRN